jgi:hypothetical protein
VPEFGRGRCGSTRRSASALLRNGHARPKCDKGTVSAESPQRFHTISTHDRSSHWAAMRRSNGHTADYCAPRPGTLLNPRPGSQALASALAPFRDAPRRGELAAPCGIDEMGRGRRAVPISGPTRESGTASGECRVDRPHVHPLPCPAPPCLVLLHIGGMCILSFHSLSHTLIPARSLIRLLPFPTGDSPPCPHHHLHRHCHPNRVEWPDPQPDATAYPLTRPKPPVTNRSRLRGLTLCSQSFAGRPAW